jgi:hypothetical protein
MKPDTVQLNTALASSSRFGSLSVRNLAKAALGRVVPQPPEYSQFVFNTLAGYEVQVYVPSDLLGADASAKGKKLNVRA